MLIKSGRNTQLLSRFNQGPDIFGKTRAAVADTGEKKSETDAIVAADPHPDLINIGPRNLTDGSDFVHKGNP
ncbi:hypothetical protein ES703_120157 [subsurface metagenome]